jgi:Glycosyltransferase family 87
LERRTPKALIGIAIIVACLATIFYVFSRPSRNGYGYEHDFVTVITGAHCVVDRCDPYDAATLEREFPTRMGGYIPAEHFKPEWPVYPPSTFLLLFPLSLLPWPVLSTVWLLLSFTFLCSAFVVLLLHSKAYRDLLSLLPFVILLSDGSIGWAVELGQPALIAASSLTIALIAVESGAMPIMGTLLLAIALILKPQGAYLCAAYFLLKARTRMPALAAYLLTAAAAAGGILLFYARLSSFSFLGHLSSNVKIALQPGKDADFSLLNQHNSASFLNLQAFLARFIHDPHICNNITYAVVSALACLLVVVCWRQKNLDTRPYTILAILVMLELLVSYHRLYDHVLMLAAIPGLYEIKQRGRSLYLYFVGALLVYHFSQFHGLTFHGLGPFPSGPPVEIFIAVVCLVSLWKNRTPEPMREA